MDLRGSRPRWTNGIARRRLVAIGLAVGAVGCVRNSGTIAVEGFRHSTYNYRVARVEGELLDGHWLLDNFHRSRRRLVQKTSSEYLTSFSLDTNGDGNVDSHATEPMYDLRFIHRQRGGVIWLRTFPISIDQSDKELRVLMRTYVDEIAGAGYEAVALEQADVVVERRFAAEMLERGDATLAGRPAHIATIDVANIDQLRVTPSSRRTRVRLVMLRPGFSYETARRSTKFPVLMMAGYSNLPEDFERDLPSFDRLLSQIEIAGHRGWSVAGIEKLSPDKPIPAQPPAPAPPADAPPAEVGATATP